MPTPADRKDHIRAVIITLAYIVAFMVSCIFQQKELIIVFFCSSMLAIFLFHNHSIYHYHRFPFRPICKLWNSLKKNAKP